MFPFAVMHGAMADSFKPTLITDAVLLFLNKANNGTASISREARFMTLLF
jgi:hypothetical protein